MTAISKNRNREGFRDVHIDRPLTNISIAHFQSTQDFVFPRFFPHIPVQHASDTFTVYPQGYFNRIHDTKRGDETAANSITYDTAKDSYTVDEDALRIFISDKKIANADGERRIVMEATEVVTNAMMVKREKMFADFFLNTDSTWDMNKTGTAAGTGTNEFKKWSEAMSDPIGDVRAWKREIVQKSGGRMPNKMLMTLDVWHTLLDHPDILDRIEGGATAGSPAMVTKQLVASLFEIDEILVMHSLYNNQTAEEVQDDEGNVPHTNMFMAEGKLLFGHVPMTYGLMKPVAGCTFMWNRYLPAGANMGPTTRRYRHGDPGIRGEYIECEMAIAHKVISKDLCIRAKAVI